MQRMGSQKPCFVHEMIFIIGGNEIDERNFFACPCCGYLTISGPPPGTFEICPVCNWEDDVEYNNIDFEGGLMPSPCDRLVIILRNSAHRH